MNQKKILEALPRGFLYSPLNFRKIKKEIKIILIFFEID